MAHTNVLNRKLEEVYGVGKEFTTVADLWGVSISLHTSARQCGPSTVLSRTSLINRNSMR